MTRRYTPKTMIGANGYPFPHSSEDDILRASKEGTANLVYIGYAAPGVLETQPGWKITKYTYDSAGDPIESGKAGGRNYYENIWDSGTTATITGITQADPAVVTTSAAHGLTTGDKIEITGVVGMTEVNAKFFQVTVLTDTTFELQDVDGNDVDSSAYTAYSSGGTVNVRDYLNYTYA